MKWTKEQIKQVLDQNDDQVARALVRLYARQTADERTTKTTNETNGQGFNGVDAPFLSSLAEQYIRKGYLTERQTQTARKSIQKYIGQLTAIANEHTGEETPCETR